MMDLSQALGNVIDRIRRVNYVGPDGSRDPREGPIEISFAGGFVVQFEPGADGESLRLVRGEWVDPFAGPLSAENEEFVRSCGKRTSFDVSSAPGFNLLIGDIFSSITPIYTFGKITGVELASARVVVHAEVVADELVVDLRVV
ncbi:hypothetical protein ACFV4P_34275 [Kitasatospora sp. NPDC059795]|uniref:hypothetical protein n=1 Tax=Kitasatospora sp. NPDC059795 TaxID=3346949 RepID=UPI003651F661